MPSVHVVNASGPDNVARVAAVVGALAGDGWTVDTSSPMVALAGGIARRQRHPGDTDARVIVGDTWLRLAVGDREHDSQIGGLGAGAVALLAMRELRELVPDDPCPVCAGHGVDPGHAATVFEIVADVLGYVADDMRERARKDVPTDHEAESLYADADRVDYAAMTIDAWRTGAAPPTVPPPDRIPEPDEETPHA